MILVRLKSDGTFGQLIERSNPLRVLLAQGSEVVIPHDSFFHVGWLADIVSLQEAIAAHRAAVRAAPRLEGSLVFGYGERCL